MADQASTVAAITAASVEAQAIGVVIPPPTGDLSWYLARSARSITNLGSAVLHAVNPCPTNQCSYSLVTKFRGVLAASGMVLLPWRGNAGTLAGFGGGHSDYGGNEVWSFDLFAKTFALLSQPQPTLYSVPSAPDWTAYHSNTDEGELWVDSNFAHPTMAQKPTRQNQPTACHAYGHTLAMTPALAGNAEGAILMPCRPSCTPGGQRHGRRAHSFDLTTKTWARYSANLMPEAPGYSHSFIDYVRARAVVHSYAGLVVLPLSPNPASRLFSKIVALPSSLNYMVWDHWTQQDLYVGLSHTVGGAPRVWIVDPLTNQWTQPGCAQPWPTPSLPAGGGSWSKQFGGFAYYHGAGESTVVVVMPPTGNPRTTPWNVQTMTFSGDAPPSDDVVGAGAHCKRFLEHEVAGGFLWLGRTSAPAQFWKL